MDVLCQAKSGMGKTAVFVLATLQQLEPVDGQVSIFVMCHTRELAFQISKEYERFYKYMEKTKVNKKKVRPRMQVLDCTNQSINRSIHQYIHLALHHIESSM